MINVLIGVSYLLYYIIKIAIKDAYYELDFKSVDSNKDDNIEKLEESDE